MMKRLKKLLLSLTILLLAAGGGGIYLFAQLRASLPIADGEREIAGLESPVMIQFDRFGIPSIQAQSRSDAFRSVGYLHARDRLFQMDLMRRAAAGRLAEIIGKLALKVDLHHRVIGFNRIAPKIVRSLPDDQREALKAYAEGVNAFLRQMKTPPFEFLVLGYRPEEPWRMEDSILVFLNMFEDLYGRDGDERMMTIMNRSLPPEVVAFLTPDTDIYATPLLGGPDSFRPIRPIPVKELVSLLKFQKKEEKKTELDLEEPSIAGSNNWAVMGSKTLDGRAILANDMHLGLSVPNIWYRAMMSDKNVRIAGVTLPGLPPIVAGSNGHLAWGFTVLMADILDLVQLEINPENADEYKTPDGWKGFETVREVIRVRWGKDVTKEVKLTSWGPVSETEIKGNPVAVHWTALEPSAVDLGVLSLAEATTLEEGLRAMNRFRGPPLNVALADDKGHIAWTLCGSIPVRQGFDGTASQSWAGADGQIGWKGMIPPEELPRVVDPPSGFVATANNRTLGKGYRYPVGYNFGEGDRAYRISERLREMDHLTEKEMFELQMDTRSRFYDFYRQIALELLTEEVTVGNPLLAEARKEIEAWNGQADLHSRGFGLLVRFRKILENLFDPFLSPCREQDPEFSYSWYNLETPLRMMLTSKIPEINPDPLHFSSWDSFILAKLEESVRQLKKEYSNELGQLTWGRMNKAQIIHPLFGTLPLLGEFFNMPPDPLAGCSHCIRVATPDFGASERMVVSPGREEEGILQMPGGQSGHPLSPHYKDQQDDWVQGRSLPFLPGPAVHRLQLQPHAENP